MYLMPDLGLIRDFSWLSISFFSLALTLPTSVSSMSTFISRDIIMVLVIFRRWRWWPAISSLRVHSHHSKVKVKVKVRDEGVNKQGD